jgi:hypothetical protein
MVCLEEVIVIRAPIDRCFDLARSVEVHLAHNIHSGESALAEAGVVSGLLEFGDCVTWRGRHFGLWHRLTAAITAMRRPEYFQDTMLRGPFRMMRHDHLFRACAPDATEMRDLFHFAAPFGPLGWISERLVLRRYMRALLRERNAVIRRFAESSAWRDYLPPASPRPEAPTRWLS